MNSFIGRNWRDAATLIVLCKNNREALRYNYEVLLQTRTQGASFKNAVVFPGGVTESCDADDEWLKLFQSFGYTNQDFKAFHRNNTPNLLLFQNNPIRRHISLRISAIRETFEELGLLICSRKRKSERSGSWGSVLADIDVKYWQKKVISNPAELQNLCKQVNCYPDIWSLHYWGNWLTPAFVKKRFDTAFFLVALESEPSLLVKNTEVAKVEWSNPSEVLERNKNKEVILYPPQSYELNRLAAWNNIEDIAKTALEGTSFCDDTLFYHVIVQAKDGLLFVYPGDDLFPSHVDYNKSTTIEIDKTISELRQDSNKAHRFEFNIEREVTLVLKNYSFNNSNMAETVIPCYLTLSG